jgi:hypothetical protein
VGASCDADRLLISIVDPSKTSNIAQYVAIGFTIVITIIAGWYMDKHERAIIPEVVYQRRKARQARLRAEASLGTHEPEDVVLAPLPRSPLDLSRQNTDHHEAGMVDVESEPAKLQV